MARAFSRGERPETGGQGSAGGPRPPRPWPLTSGLWPLLVVALAVVLGGATLAQTSDRARAEELSRRAAARLRALHAEAEALARQERTILNELRQLEIDRRIRTEEVAKFDAELMFTEAELKSAVAREAALQKQVVTAAPVVGARLASLYKMGRPGYWRLLLGIEEMGGVGRAYRTVAAMARIDRDRVEEHQRTLAALRTTREGIEKRTAEARRLRADAARARAALDRAIASRNARVVAIDRERDLTARYAGELQDAQRRLQSSLGDIAGGSASVSLPIAPFRGDLPWPARGRVTIPFGRQRASRFGTSITRNGIQIAAPEGRNVQAVHEGTVAFAGPFTGYGQLVIVDHGGESYSLYGHLDSIAVERGQAVERQRPVGTVGRTPLGTPALYFELRIDGRPVDPLQWLKR